MFAFQKRAEVAGAFPSPLSYVANRMRSPWAASRVWPLGNAALASLSPELSGIVGNVLACRVEPNRDDIATRLHGDNRSLAVVRNSVDVGTASLVLDLVAGCVALNAHLAPRVLLDQHRDGMGVAAEFSLGEH